MTSKTEQLNEKKETEAPEPLKRLVHSLYKAHDYVFFQAMAEILQEDECPEMAEVIQELMDKFYV